MATPLANLQEFADVLYFAEDEGQWLQVIENALDEADCDLRAKRIEVARENGWASRVEAIVSVFNDTLSETT